MPLARTGRGWRAGPFAFANPLNKERRFIPLRLDDAEPKGTLAQFPCVDWRGGGSGGEYGRLLGACRTPEPTLGREGDSALTQKLLSLGHVGGISSVSLSADGKRALSGSADNTVRLWDVETGRALRVLEGHTDSVLSVAWSGAANAPSPAPTIKRFGCGMWRRTGAPEVAPFWLRGAGDSMAEH
jgi:hypothetical protein